MNGRRDDEATILLVHDARSRRRYLRGLLEAREGWTVVETVSAELGDELAERLPDALVVEVGVDSGVDADRMTRIAQRPDCRAIVGIAGPGTAECPGVHVIDADEVEAGLVAAVESVLAGPDAVGDPLADHLTEQRVRYELPNEPTVVAVAADWLVRLTSPWVADPHQRDALVVGLAAMLESMMLHGNLEIGSALAKDPRAKPRDVAARRANRQPYVGRRLHVSAKITPARSGFEIEHEGPAFDWSDVGDGSVLSRIGELFDDVRTKAGGNTVSLVKRHPRIRRQHAAAPPVTTARPPNPIRPEGSSSGSNHQTPILADDSSTILATELVGDALLDSNPELQPGRDSAGDAGADSSDRRAEEGATPEGSELESPPRPRRRPARIDRDVTDLLGNAPRVDGFGNPIDD